MENVTGATDVLSRQSIVNNLLAKWKGNLSGMSLALNQPTTGCPVNWFGIKGGQYVCNLESNHVMNIIACI